MDEVEHFRYLTSEEFLALSEEKRAAYLGRVKEHLAALEESQRRDRDLDNT